MSEKKSHATVPLNVSRYRKIYKKPTTRNRERKNHHATVPLNVSRYRKL